jgi:predicted aconitase with swiveling domain
MDMKKRIVLKGRGLTSGITEGEALVSKESINWVHGVRPATGRISDVYVKVCGENVKNKILVYPLGKGSTCGSTWMLETTQYGNAPKAIINRETELIILSGAVLSEVMYGVQIPIVDRLDQNPDEVIETGDWVRVDGDKGIVEVTKRR